MKEIGTCRHCGKQKPLSTRGVCTECAAARIDAAIEQMKNRKGAIYQKWKRARIRGDKKV